MTQHKIYVVHRVMSKRRSQDIGGKHVWQAETSIVNHSRNISVDPAWAIQMQIVLLHTSAIQETNPSRPVKEKCYRSTIRLLQFKSWLPLLPSCKGYCRLVETIRQGRHAILLPASALTPLVDQVIHGRAYGNYMVELMLTTCSQIPTHILERTVMQTPPKIQWSNSRTRVKCST